MPSSPYEKDHVVVLVLGDLGRSPRMQYHALSLLEHSVRVTLVGYSGEKLIPSLEDARRWKIEPSSSSLLHVIRFDPPCPPQSLRRMNKLIYLALRLLGLLFGLIYALWFRVPRGHPQHPVTAILVQNPPSIPTLILSYAYCLSYTIGNLFWRILTMRQERNRHRPRLIIDWHNLGYTMFEPSNSKINRLIRTLAKKYESIMAPMADGHLCVTMAMKQWLQQHFLNVQEAVADNTNFIRVLKDRPPEFFTPTNIATKHDLMMRLKSQFQNGISAAPWYKRFLETNPESATNTEQTLFTERITKTEEKGKQNSILLRKDRPALVVSSTSWTPDEDFSLLLDATILLDDMIKQQQDTKTNPSSAFPPVIVVVTGKGPQKSFYEQKIATLSLSHVSILTMWLESADYPLLLGCADLGISLHASTSNLDLPMKILDMFGCGVPVCAVDYACLSELVEDGVNGTVFRSSNELANQMFQLLGSIWEAKEGNLLSTLKKGVENERKIRWRENWIEHAKPVILNE